MERMADLARPIAMRFFRSELGLSLKADLTPVTLADRAVEETLRGVLANEAPSDGILGEEMGASGLDGERLWIIDPIDGTGAFATGSPLFGVLIGLMDRGRPFAGLIDACAMGERWVGRRGAGAWLNGSRCHTSGRRRLRDAAIGSTAIHAYAPGARAAFHRVAEVASLVRLGGDCYAYGLVAAGHLDAVVETGLMPYDYLPLVPLIEEAGGVMTDWSGAPLSLRSDGSVVAAATRDLHQDIIGRLAANQ